MKIIAIDGGGTKTKFVLYDENGTELNVIEKPTVHIMHQDYNVCKQILKDTVNELDSDREALIVAGLAGYGQEEKVRQQIEKLCQESFGHRKYCLYNDVQIALAGALGGQDGIVVIAGTGSIGFSMNHNVFKRCGGWGNQLGDEGSAYWIAKKMLSVYCQQIDGRLEKTVLYDIIKEKLNLSHDYDIISYINNLNDDRTSIAKLAKINFECAHHGDKYALEIYEQAAYELFRLINALSKNFDGEFKVSYIGGAIVSNNYILKYLEKEVEKIHGQLISPQYTPEYGAFLLGKEVMKNE